MEESLAATAERRGAAAKARLLRIFGVEAGSAAAAEVA